MKVKNSFLAFLVACAMVITGCGEHSFDEIFGLNSSGLMLSSSSSARTGGLSSSTTTYDPIDGEGSNDVVIIPDDDELASLLSSDSHFNAVVGPLLQTKWGQGTPYKNMLPAGHRSFCNLVAASQIMKYHNHPARGSGQTEAYTMSNGVQVPALNFNNMVYDWDNMLNSYRSDGRNSTELQRNAVATLIYNAGVGRGRDFITGSSKNSWPVVLTTFFGYDRSIQRHDKKYYDEASWAAIIKQQLNAGLPVLCNGNNQDRTSNHYFVIDGYDNTGKFHINFGWSGSHDGWYSLNSIRGWDYDQHIITNIKPNEGGVPVGYEMALASLIASKTTVSQNELFIVEHRFRNIGMEQFPGGQTGAALVDNNGNIVEIIGIRSLGTLNVSSTGSVRELNCAVPNSVAPGQYQLRIVIKTDEGWEIVTKSMVGDGIPSAVNITVTAGEALGGGYGMALTSFTASKTTIPQNELFTVSSQFRNVGLEQFPGGQAGAALVDDNGNIVEIIGTRSAGSLNAGSNASSRDLNAYVPETVAPGQYRLRIIVKPTDSDEWRFATMSMGDVSSTINFTVTPYRGETPGGGYGLVLEQFESEIKSATLGENTQFSVTVKLRNKNEDRFPGGQLYAALLDGNGNIVENIGNTGLGGLGAGNQYSRTVTCKVPNTTAPGQYQLRMVLKSSDNEQLRVATLSLPDVPNGIDFEVR